MSKKRESKSHTTCVRCGTKKYCRPDVYDKRVKAFKTEDRLTKLYTCRDCCKKHNTDKFGVVKQIKPKKKRASKAQKIAKTMQAFTVLSEDTRFAQIINAKEDICMRPSLYRSNGGCCNNCPWFKVCKFEHRNLHAGDLPKPDGDVSVVSEFSLNMLTTTEQIRREYAT